MPRSACGQKVPSGWDSSYGHRATGRNAAQTGHDLIALVIERITGSFGNGRSHTPAMRQPTVGCVYDAIHLLEKQIVNHNFKAALPRTPGSPRIFDFLNHSARHTDSQHE